MGDRPTLSKHGFKLMAEYLAVTFGAKDMKFHADYTNMTVDEFIEETKRFDPVMAQHVQDWIDVGIKMGDYIRSRKETK